PLVEGTLVKRGTPLGTRYSLELIFQGDDNVDIANSFEQSAKDTRAWNVSHPIYDSLLIQPISMGIDNSGINTARFSVEAIETISEEYPKTSIDAADKTAQDINDQITAAADDFANDVVPNVSDLNQLGDNTDTVYNKGSELVTDTDIFNDYFNSYQAANAAILDGTSEPLAMITAIQAVIRQPALFSSGVFARLNNLKAQALALSETLENISTVNEKKIYENNAGTLLITMVEASINPLESDYGNSTEVISMIDLLLEQYDTYISNIESLQTLDNYSETSYIPKYNSISQLSAVVEYAVANLLVIALNAQQEISVILEYDSNIINLTHRFYGLDADDSMIDEFIKNNSIGLNEKLQIRKGRKLIYFV
ncbi:MAG: hypothetical protein KAU20_03315, partial [Nanoarchaeota archaeon]|nr:hypothetical protein [Nanoarchaeota archaeon]